MRTNCSHSIGVLISTVGLMLLASGCYENATVSPSTVDGSGTSDTPSPDTAPTPNPGSDEPSVDPGDSTDAPIGAEPQLRALTRLELEASLAWVLGPVSIPETAPELRRAGLARVGARDAVLSSTTVETHASMVDGVLEQVFTDASWRDALIGCGANDSACPADFVRRVGQRAWRRPLSDAEVGRYLQLFDTCVADAKGDIQMGYYCAASGLLQSPWFVYRVELSDSDGYYRGYAMASRLSYLLWGAPPDLDLLKKAHAGALDTAEGVRATATTMLADPRARKGLRSFVWEWFRLDRLERLRRDVLAETAEDLQFALGKEATLQPWLEWWVYAAREELQQMVEHQVFDLDQDYVELLTTDRTFIDDRLHNMYRSVAAGGEDGGAEPFGVASAGNAIQMVGQKDAKGFAEAKHAADSPRRGLIGTMAVLSQLGKQNETSPTRRGVYIMRRVLCLEVGEPPDDIDQCQRPEGTSRRESMEVHHMCAPTCAGCHRQMDPIGFALDKYDTLGRFRTTDDWGYELNTTVNWTLIDKGQTQDIPFDSLRSMADQFAALPQATNCVTKQMFRFATGREESTADEEELAALTNEFVSGGRRLKGFLVHFVGTDAFRRSAPTTDADAPAPTLEQVVEKVFTPHCGSCHVITDLGGLNLKNDGGLAQRLTAASVGLPNMPLITPGQPEQSYLWLKVMGTHGAAGGGGARMPPTEPLHSEEIDLLRAWIVSLNSDANGGVK